MKIGIDARLYGAKHGGIGRYAQELIRHLEKADEQNQYIVFLQKDNFDEYQPKNKNFKKRLANYRAYSWQEQLFFPIQLRMEFLDLTHFTHFNAPLLFNGNFIVTIHDLIISHYPDSRATTLPLWFYRIKLFFYNLAVKVTAKKAKKIIAVSEFTKKDIVGLLKIKADKIKVIYEGVPNKGEVATSLPALTPRNDICEDYLLYVGSAYPHKNLEKLLFAFQELIKKKPELKLVLVGKTNYFYQRLKNEIKNLDLENKVMLTGYADEEKLAWLYQNASAYVFPSLIEGFGLPPLEAQVYGVPVVSSNVTCLPEILGSSAIYFDPEDVNDMADKIKQVLNNDELRQKLILKGYENVKKYSWRKCAEQTLEEYNI